MEKLLSEILDMIETIDVALDKGDQQDTQSAIDMARELVNYEIQQAWINSMLSGGE
jgi:hypothetical protein